MGHDKTAAVHKTRNSLNMISIFRCMMEQGYCPTYEQTYILFDIEDNAAVLEYNEGILSVRIFFSIDEEAYDLFLEASNAAMLESFLVKPIILDNMKNIMFCCDMMCDNVREFRKFLPRAIGYLLQGIATHKKEMSRLVMAEKTSSTTINAAEDTDIFSHKGVKLLS